MKRYILFSFYILFTLFVLVYVYLCPNNSILFCTLNECNKLIQKTYTKSENKNYKNSVLKLDKIYQRVLKRESVSDSANKDYSYLYINFLMNTSLKSDSDILSIIKTQFNNLSIFCFSKNDKNILNNYCLYNNKKMIYIYKSAVLLISKNFGKSNLTNQEKELLNSYIDNIKLLIESSLKNNISPQDMTYYSLIYEFIADFSFFNKNFLDAKNFAIKSSNYSKYRKRDKYIYTKFEKYIKEYESYKSKI